MKHLRKPKMKVEIRHTRVAHLFGRTLIYAQLYSSDDKEVILSDTTLVAVLQYIDENDCDCVNAQDILNYVVRINGFGA